MFIAPRTKLLVFHTAGLLFLILRGRVIPSLTVSTF